MQISTYVPKRFQFGVEGGSTFQGSFTLRGGFICVSDVCVSSELMLEELQKYLFWAV
jgi:hypothetical protein